MKQTKADTEKEKIFSVSKRGKELINDPLLNKGTCFTLEERRQLGLTGLLPPRVFSLDEQLMRLRENYNHLKTDLDKYVFIEAVHDRNETLYYRFLVDNLEELSPIIYTPTVGHACQVFGHLYRRPRGMYLSSSLQGSFRKTIDNWPQEEVDIIVVTDGSRILGLGDLGANGMGIPIGKLALYVACAGIDPSRTLPVMLDAGTNNEELLADKLYLGEQHKKPLGDEYYELVYEFMIAARDRWPKALIQFEDFTNDHAFSLLHKYRSRFLCFNDDLQGTGAVALAGLLAALRVTGEKIQDQRIVFLGAGTAAVGSADMMAAVMVENGLTPEQARKQFWLVDSKGLVTTGRGDTLAEHKVPYAQEGAYIETLLDVIKQVKPTVLLGLSMQSGAFNEEVIKAMQKHVERPIIFALSNPTSKAECTPDQVYRWTNGSGIYASGSPFAPVEYNGRTFKPCQGNNMYIFPGVGLGATLSEAGTVTDSMFLAAAKTLAAMVGEQELEVGALYPSLTQIRDLSAAIATAVWETAWSEGNAAQEVPDNPIQFVKEKMYFPDYPTYQPA
jgi:malate dehydrogenase (oxaloacetate-decarboxylating)(NADP+)